MISAEHEQTLHRVDIFRDLGSAELGQLAAAATVVRFPVADPILHEGDPGDAAYVVLTGSVQVFTIDPTGQEIVLSRLEPYAIFGEQALLPGRGNRRNASVRAYEDVTLLKILKENFQKVLSRQHRLKEQLIQLGEEQVRSNLMRASALFRSLRIGDTAAGHHEVVFPDGHVVFREGDAADCCYVILAGTAGVYHEADGSLQLLARLRQGQCFGEAALIRRAPRAATVIAEGELRAVVIDGQRFLEAYENNAELRQYTESLQKVYLLPRRGFLTQYLGKFLDHDCVTTTYHLFDGSHATVAQVIGQDIYNMALSGDGAPEKIETIRYEDRAAGTERELQIVGGKIVGMTVRGPWEQLAKVQERVLDRAPFHPWEAALFRRQGTLQTEAEPNFHDDNETICTCVQVKRGTLRQGIEQGKQTPEALMSLTGAGTVCGTCIIRLKEMVGRADWTPVKIAATQDFTEDIRAFRLVPTSGAVKPSRPGQHIVLQGQIEGKWVQRAYTLSSSSQEQEHYEVTIKREPHGVFTQWLFNQRPDNAMIQASSPQGTYFLDIEGEDSRPCVCLVAGIGVTPAVAICRSILRGGKERRLHVDYSVETEDRLAAYGDEFLAAARQAPLLTVKLRVAARDGMIARTDVDRIAREHPDAVYFLCGPSAFQDAVEKHLRDCGVPDDRVNIEEFTPSGGPPPGAKQVHVPRLPTVPTVKAVEAGPGAGFGTVDAAQKLPPLEEARIYLEWFYKDKGAPEAFPARWQEVEKEFRDTGLYTQTYDELAYGAKLAWRNSTRCIGRLFWQGLQVRDLRQLTTEEEVFAAIVEHVKLATNGGNLRATISVFAPGKRDAPAFRIWNPLVLRYAGYEQPDGSVIGDPAQVELTKQLQKYGWKGGPGTPFDIVPLLIQRGANPPKVFELPRDIIIEVPIEHPRYKWFAELGLKWFGLPMVCDMELDLGGVSYKCVPFNGFYMGTEIGARNFGDEHRYNLLPVVASRLGLDTHNDRSLWKDQALLELNVAVLHSYEKHGVKLTDHHRAAQDFMRFVAAESEAGRKTNADWAWLIPPISASSVPVFHVPWENNQLKPNFFYQKKAWATD